MNKCNAGINDIKKNILGIVQKINSPAKPIHETDCHRQCFCRNEQVCLYIQTREVDNIRWALDYTIRMGFELGTSSLLFKPYFPTSTVTKS